MVVLLCLSTFTINVKAAEKENSYSMTAGFTSDQFFGFAPMMTGEYTLSDQVSFSFYGLFWSGGTGAGWGNWTEFGAGVNYKPTNWLAINPQIGVVNGNLLSSSAAGPSIFGDGLVPNLTVNIIDDTFEGQLYAGLYMPLREVEATPAPNATNFPSSNYTHIWVNTGYKLSSFLSLGVHYEQLDGGVKDAETTVYQWFGPYVQFSDPNKKGSLRFSGGTDLVDKVANDSFFKLTVLVNL